MVSYDKVGAAASLAVPTPDHYFPLLYAIGLTENGDQPSYYAERNTMGSISMRSIKFG